MLKAPSQSLSLKACAGGLAAEGSGIVNVNSWPNNFQISVGCVQSLLEFTTEIHRKSGDDMNDIDTNSLIWGYVGCSSSSWEGSFGEFTFYQKSATTNDKTMVSQKLITDQTEIQGLSEIDWRTHA